MVTNAVANSVSVLLGNGNGTFQPQTVYPVGFDPYSMTVAQFTGDGDWDIVTANRGDNTVSVLLGNGNGTFQPEQVYPSGSAPRGVAVADFNGDGNVDIVNTNQGDDTATILWSNGDGTFTSEQGQAAPAPTLRPFQVVVADLTDNGLPDIITADRSDNSVGVLLANRRRLVPDQGNLSDRSAADLGGRGRPGRRRHRRHRHGQLRRRPGQRAHGQRQRHVPAVFRHPRRQRYLRRQAGRPDRRRPARHRRHQQERQHGRRHPERGGRQVRADGRLSGRVGSL